MAVRVLAQQSAQQPLKRDNFKKVLNPALGGKIIKSLFVLKHLFQKVLIFMCQLCKNLDKKVASGEGYTLEEFDEALLVHLRPLGITEIGEMEVPEESANTYEVRFFSTPKPNLKEKYEDYFVGISYNRNKDIWRSYKYYKNEFITNLASSELSILPPEHHLDELLELILEEFK